MNEKSLFFFLVSYETTTRVKIFCSFWTYALIVTSNRIAAIGMINRPSQKTGDENKSLSMPANTAAIGIDGQKLLENKNK